MHFFLKMWTMRLNSGCQACKEHNYYLFFSPVTHTISLLLALRFNQLLSVQSLLICPHEISVLVMLNIKSSTCELCLEVEDIAVQPKDLSSLLWLQLNLNFNCFGTEFRIHKSSTFCKRYSDLI